MIEHRLLFRMLAPAAVVAWIVLVCLANPARGQANADGDVRLFEHEPYDLLRLNDENQSTLRIQPLPAAERRGVKPDGRPGKLTVRLLEAPDQPYEVAWSDIAEVKLFEQMVLEECQQLVEAGKFDEAYEYFQYLQENYPRMPNLPAALERYLWLEARHWLQAAQPEMAWTLLTELHRRNPQYAELSALSGETITKLVDQAIGREDFAAARAYVRALQARFAEHPTALAAESRLKSLAAEAADRGRANFVEQKFAEAYTDAGLALEIWPADVTAKQLLTELAERYPRVVVAVTSPALEKVAEGFADFGALRRRQLTTAHLMEFRGYGPDGAEYASPVADFREADLGRRLEFAVRPGIRYAPTAREVTGADVARRLVSAARSSAPGSRTVLADLMASVSVSDVYQVEVEMTRQSVRPAAYFEIALQPGGSELGSLAMYGRVDADDGAQRYVLSIAATPASGQPREIVERPYESGADGLAALRRGEATVLDRVNPWEIAGLRSESEYVVEQYATPVLHVLVPNRQRPLPADRNFRRALVYALNRQAILEKLIVRGPLSSGNRVISGPFPVGAALDDPRGYANDEQIKPRPYDARLALTLFGVARLNQKPGSGADTKLTEEEAKQPLELRLAHPASDVPRLACRAIQRQLQALHVNVELIEFGSDVTQADWDDCDFVYRELAVRDPLVDAQRLLGSDGALGSSNPYLDLALARLLEADNSKDSRARLHELHRLAAEDVTLIPLWQLIDSFAYHRSLTGVGEQPATLYQHARDWRPGPRLPTVAP